MNDQERHKLALATADALHWRLRAELLMLAQAPTTPDAYVARATERVATLLDAAQVVFWAHDPDTESLEARHAATFEPVADVPRAVFLEALSHDGAQTVALPDGHGGLRAFVLAPVHLDDALQGVFQVTPMEAVMDLDFEKAVGVAAEAAAIGLGTVHAFERLSFEASHDPLTGLANRRAFRAVLDRELKLAQRHDAPVSLLVVDADHFKRYNDTHGHPAGDALLKAIAERLAEVVRSTDFVARYGGEEFVVVLPHTDQHGALAASRKVLEGIRSLHADYPDLPGDHITASIGLATFPPDALDADALFHAADQALYRAKSAGRDRVEVA